MEGDIEGEAFKEPICSLGRLNDLDVCKYGGVQFGGKA
jgi:hypothetical protein